MAETLTERNEISIHTFLEMDFASHKRLLRQLEHGEFTGCEAGLRALPPHLQFSANGMWEIHLLEEEAASPHHAGWS